MPIATYGPNAVDWEERIDLTRLRNERLARLKTALEQSDLGAVLSFDFGNIRYMTATHIGTWAMDKLIRFALLPRGGDPIVWDFGSAARHHQLYNPWLDHTGGPATPEGAARTGAAAGITAVDGQQVFMEARRVKTRDEITLLAQPCSMVDAAYSELYEFLRPGV